MLYQVEYNSKIAENVLKAFKALHAKKLHHGDVRVENILVRSDNSVVVVDFESSEINADPKMLSAEMEEVKSLLASLE
jgi:DNA-binding helix-hairpin-helix protein with protein kinase domain